MNKPTTQELIEKYISGSMQGDELIKFQSEIDRNSDLAQEVKLELKIQEASGNQELNEFYQVSSDVIYGEKKDHSKIKFRVWFLLIGFLLILLSLFLFSKSENSNAHYAYNAINEASTKQVNPYETNIRSNEGDIQVSIESRLWNNYYTSFNQKEFDSAFEHLNELKEILKDDPSILYQEALLQIINNNYDGAVNLLLKTTESFDLSKWLLALCYIELEDKDSAKAWLESISNTIHPRQAEATKLLEQQH